MKSLHTKTLRLTRMLSLLLLTLLLFLLCAVNASALSADQVVDNAELLTAGEEVSLSDLLAQVRSAYNIDIAVITVTSTGGKNIQTFADTYYDTHGYGIGESRSGILLMVAMSTREYAMTTYGDAKDIFGENDFDALEDAFVSYLSDGEYYKAFAAFAEASAHAVKYDDRLTPTWIIVSLLVGIAVATIVIVCMVSKHKNVKFRRDANSYMQNDTFHLDRSRDIFLYSHVSRVAKPKNTGTGGSRGGSRGGRSHGGRSGRF